MADVIEYEKTYLCAKFPGEFVTGEPDRMIDVYVPEAAHHPKLRLRFRGGRYEITKKAPIDTDASQQLEQTIPLMKDEFDELATVSNRRVEKLRFSLLYNGFVGELDVFSGEHAGLILVDFEFEDVESMERFSKPDFCSEDVSNEVMVAGGLLSGLGRDELFASLSDKYGYMPVDTSELIKNV